jgi:hypothetical protein
MTIAKRAALPSVEFRTIAHAATIGTCGCSYGPFSTLVEALPGHLKPHDGANVDTAL